jgi:exportin-T|tara:strand:+ start:36495 stop:36905 length:411 start_codon:yes stop_codon:yes gene_type:complete
MINVWSGPDKVGPGANPTPTSPVATQAPLEGFDNYVVDRFSPLAWSVPASPGFNPKDAQARQVLYEAANLQTEIVKKVGEPYVERLKGDLSSNGVGGDGVDQYLRTLAGALEGSKKEKEWRNFFVQFVDRMLASRS